MSTSVPVQEDGRSWTEVGVPPPRPSRRLRVRAGGGSDAVMPLPSFESCGAVSVRRVAD